MTMILYISAHLPHPNAPQAGHRVAWNNLLRLSLEGPVYVLLFLNSDEAIGVFPAWPNRVKICAVVRVGKLQRLLSMVFSCFRLAPRFATRWTAGARSAVRLALKEQNYTKVWLEFSATFPFSDLIPSDLPCEFSVQDVQLQWCLRAAMPHCLTAPLIYRDEARFFARADVLECYSTKDAQLISALYSHKKIVVRSPQLSEFVTRVTRTKESIVPSSFIFWGALSRRENSEAILWFLRTCWPEVRRVKPNAQLYVVGSAPPAELRSFDGNGVVVTGFVEDPQIWFERAAFGIAPLSEGAGVKVKVLEMLACGLPVLATPVGAEGIDTNRNLKVVERTEFRSSVLEALQNEVHLGD